MHWRYCSHAPSHQFGTHFSEIKIWYAFVSSKFDPYSTYISQAGISNYIPQFTVGCNYLSLPGILAYGDMMCFHIMGNTTCLPFGKHFEMHFLGWQYLYFLIAISLEFILKGPIDNNLTLAWCWTSENLLPGLMMAEFTDAYLPLDRDAVLVMHYLAPLISACLNLVKKLYQNKTHLQWICEFNWQL